jgi:hypothetical protein
MRDCPTRIICIPVLAVKICLYNPVAGSGIKSLGKALSLLPACIFVKQKRQNKSAFGPVVEWILRKSPELKIQVRFLSGPLITIPASAGGDCNW